MTGRLRSLTYWVASAVAALCFLYGLLSGWLAFLVIRDHETSEPAQYVVRAAAWLIGAVLIFLIGRMIRKRV